MGEQRQCSLVELAPWPGLPLVLDRRSLVASRRPDTPVVARVCVEPQGKSVTPLVHRVQQSTKTFVPTHSTDVPRRLAGNQFAPGIRGGLASAIEVERQAHRVR